MINIPNIALTMGDPAGIGPELAVKAAATSRFAEKARIIIYGCPDIIQAAAQKFTPHLSPEKLHIKATGQLRFSNVVPGRASAECGLAAKTAVVDATIDTLADKTQAIVTTPINKASVNLAGVPFSGHTELIAELCNCDNFAMMQSAGNLRVAFVTTHIPLRQVANAITGEKIIAVANMLENAIKAEAVERPRIAAAAINPHAGESGYMGQEDELIVKPALAELRRRGMNIVGPFPPDTLFIESIRSRFDGILSMYHDQGHIPFKMLAFDRGVNSTLGLPIIRTSVDHGTAFEIAWQDKADIGSLFAAIELAIVRIKKHLKAGTR